MYGGSSPVTRRCGVVLPVQPVRLVPEAEPLGEVRSEVGRDPLSLEDPGVGIDLNLLRDLCDKTLDRTELPALGERIEGKVRDSYVRDGRRTIIVSDLS